MNIVSDINIINRLRNIQTIKRRPLLNQRCVTWIVYDKYRNRLFTGGSDNTIIVRDYNTNQPIKILQSAGKIIISITFMSKPGEPPKKIVSSDTDGQIMVWNADNYECERVIQTYRWGDSSMICISETTLISGSHYIGDILKYWDISRKKSLIRTARLYSVCLSILEIDKDIIACGNGKLISLFLIKRNFKLLKMLSGHKNIVKKLIKLPNRNNLIISSAMDSCIRIWKWRTGECVRVLYHRGRAYYPRSKYLEFIYF